MITTSRKYPTILKVKHDQKVGWIVIDQIRTIDKQRIVGIVGRLSKLEVKTVVKETFIDRRIKIRLNLEIYLLGINTFVCEN